MLRCPLDRTTVRRMDLRYVPEDERREVTYAKGKLRLMRKAMELAVQCNAQVALVMFDDAGRLAQFSTSDMDQLLESYGKAVLNPHERYTPHDLLYGSVYANGFGVGPAAQATAAARSAPGGAAASPAESPSGASEACQAGIGTHQLLGPLGLAVDAASFPPLSPRSEAAYSTIYGEFERMLSAMTSAQLDQQHALAQLQRQQQRHAKEARQQQRQRAGKEEQEEAAGTGAGAGSEVAAGAAGRPLSASTPSSSMPPPAARRPPATAGAGALDGGGGGGSPAPEAAAGPLEAPAVAAAMDVVAAAEASGVLAPEQQVQEPPAAAAAWAAPPLDAAAGVAGEAGAACGPGPAGDSEMADAARPLGAPAPAGDCQPAAVAAAAVDGSVERGGGRGTAGRVAGGKRTRGKRSSDAGSGGDGVV
ncbi:MAG: hypothetical protein J3K34DRAFT_526819 [Monoraphidium minutum]|nr:MAG: hypothetical protein J3K34DRAFT_526819 [Monoraphidium minutum]